MGLGQNNGGSTPQKGQCSPEVTAAATAQWEGPGSEVSEATAPRSSHVLSRVFPKKPRRGQEEKLWSPNQPSWPRLQLWTCVPKGPERGRGGPRPHSNVEAASVN